MLPGNTCQPDCRSCAESMMGNDELLRCRINGLPCSPANAEDCERYEYEPGTDTKEWLQCSCIQTGRKA